MCVCVGGGGGGEGLKQFEHFIYDIFSFFVYVKISPLLLKGKMEGGGGGGGAFPKLVNPIPPAENRYLVSFYRMIICKTAQLKNIFLISQPKHMLWVLKRTVSLRRYF